MGKDHKGRDLGTGIDQLHGDGSYRLRVMLYGQRIAEVSDDLNYLFDLRTKVERLRQDMATKGGALTQLTRWLDDDRRPMPRQLWQVLYLPSDRDTHRSKSFATEESALEWASDWLLAHPGCAQLIVHNKDWDEIEPAPASYRLLWSDGEPYRVTSPSKPHAVLDSEAAAVISSATGGGPRMTMPDVTWTPIPLLRSVP